MEEINYLDEFITNDDTHIIQEKDLLKIDKLFKKCKFNEVVDFIKNEFLAKLNQDNKFNNLALQTILTIYIFSLLKLQKFDQVNDTFNKHKFEDNETLFPFRFLEGKYYYMINDVPSAMIIFHKLINLYSQDEENNSIISIENKCDFKYFGNIFLNLFSLKNTDSKIKKCYFELKNCFQKLGSSGEAYKVIEKCYEKYPDDIVIEYEMIKESILVSNFIKVEEIYNKMREHFLSLKEDDNMKTIYENYLNFAEGLTWISKGEFEIAKNKFTDILRNNPDNVLIVNNIAALNLFLNKIDKSYSDFKIILDKDQMNASNEVTNINVNVLYDYFNIPKI